MENGLYRIAKDDLRRLDAGEAVALLSDLRWAEATQPEIPIRKGHKKSTNIMVAGLDFPILARGTVSIKGDRTSQSDWDS